MKFRPYLYPPTKITIWQAKKMLSENLDLYFRYNRFPSDCTWEILKNLESFDWLETASKSIDPNYDWNEQIITPFMVQQLELSEASCNILNLHIRYGDAHEFKELTHAF